MSQQRRDGVWKRPVSCRWIIAMLLASTDEALGPDPQAAGAEATAATCA